jgi:transposase
VNEITTVGVDLAKEVIVVCGADARGRVVLRKQLSFAGFAAWAANLPPCVMGMESCRSAHHWARTLQRLGHEPRLMTAEVVAPFRMSRGAKNDHNDAEAIMVAVRQPTMRFVSVKSVDDQAVLSWHRARRGFMEERKSLLNRTRGLLAEFGIWVGRSSAVLSWHRARSGFMEERKSLLNRTRGLLAEFGIWVGRSSAVLIRKLPQLMDEPTLPDLFKPILLHTLEHLRQLKQRIEECDARICAHAEDSEAAQRIQKLSGVGVLTASALVASIASPNDFRNGRQMAAWAGLVPRQHSSGGKSRLPAGPADAGGPLHAAGGAQV